MAESVWARVHRILAENPIPRGTEEAPPDQEDRELEVKRVAALKRFIGRSVESPEYQSAADEYVEITTIQIRRNRERRTPRRPSPW